MHDLRSIFSAPWADAVNSARRLGIDTDYWSISQNAARISFELNRFYPTEMHRTGACWGEVFNRPDVPDEIWNHEVVASFACGLANSHWDLGVMPFGAFALMTQERVPNGSKHERGCTLAAFRGARRVIGAVEPGEGIIKVTGMSLDDDGVVGRDIEPNFLIPAYSTASDGRDVTFIECEAYRAKARDLGISLIPTEEGLAAVLNDGLRHGPAYRDVVLGSPGVVRIGNELNFKICHMPQQRTRYPTLFAHALEGSLLDEVLSIPHGVRIFGEELEFEVLGKRGTDRTCLSDLARVGYLPIGTSSKFFAKVIGKPQLYDPRPLAEKVIAENPKRSAKVYSVSPFTAVPQELKRNLRGVRLASLIADAYPELVRSENNLSPLSLHRCPFAEEHRSKRGQSDGSVYCYDPDQTPYAVMRCRHDTCAGRTRVEEFVEAMIEQGDLDRETVYDNPDYRDDYDEEKVEPALPPVAPGWRNHVSKE